MTKFLFFFSFAILLGFSSSNAAVRCITDVNSFGYFSVGDSDVSFKLNNKALCTDAGYTLTTCEANMLPDEICPYDTGYFKSCKCNSDYYSVEEGNQLSVCGKLATTESCSDKNGTHYSCRCSDATNTLTECSGNDEYITPENRASNNFCRDNRNLETYYYPKSICQTCSSPYTINAAQSGCSCASEFIVCDLGHEAGAESCTENGVTKYNKCKSCPNRGIYSICPNGYTCSFENCSAKYYITGCASGYVNLDNCSWKCKLIPIMPK